MPKPPPDDGSSPDPTLESGFDEVQPDGARAPAAQPVAPAKRTDPEWVEATDTVTRPLAPDTLDDEGPAEPAGRGPRRPSRNVQVGAIAAVVVVLVGAALLYRSHHRKQVLAKGLAHAERVARADTYAGYREASQVLEPLVPIDPIAAGAARAWALAMLATDYRDTRAAQDAEGLLVEPERATEVPPAANLALAALALGRQKAGTAATYAARPGGGAPAHVLQARVAFLAANPAGAVEPLDAALAAEPRLAAALALRGDALRRTRNPAAARQAYLSALEASPLHPRAAYGLAKLALSGQARPEEAIPPLERLLGDRAGTPSNERGRAALHLAALKGRGGDRAGAQRAIESSGATGSERAWLEKAVAEEELSRTGYRVIDGAPPGLLSASDDDPYEPPPPPPPAPVVKKEAAKPAAKKAPTKAGKATKKAKPPAKKGATKPAAKKSSTTKPPP